MKYSAYSITFSPLHFMFYRGKSITFGTVYALSDLQATEATLVELGKEGEILRKGAINNSQQTM